MVCREREATHIVAVWGADARLCGDAVEVGDEYDATVSDEAGAIISTSVEISGAAARVLFAK